MARWEVTEQIEILQEFFADVIAKYVRFFVKNNIEATPGNKDSLVKLYFLLCKAKHDSLSARSLTEVAVFKGKCAFCKELIDDVFVE